MRKLGIILFLLISNFSIYANSLHISVIVNHKKLVVGEQARIDFVIVKPSSSISWVLPKPTESYLILAKKTTDTLINDTAFIKYSLFLTSLNVGECTIKPISVILTNNGNTYTLKTPSVSLNFLASKPIESLEPLADIESLPNKVLFWSVLKFIVVIISLTLAFLWWKNRFKIDKPIVYNQSWALNSIRKLGISNPNDYETDLPSVAFQILKKHLIYIGFSVNNNDSEKYVYEKISASLNEEMQILFKKIIEVSLKIRFSPSPVLTQEAIDDLNTFIIKLVPPSSNGK